jgi:hypothetical protein
MADPVIDATIGGTSANSYQSVSDSDAYFNERLNADAWFNASAGDKARAKIMATRRLERENWNGERTSATQRLAFPRIGLLKPDRSGGGLGDLYGYGECYGTDEIPDLVKQAENELAVALLDGFGDDSDTIEEFAESGGMRVKFRNNRLEGELPGNVLRLIAPLISAGTQLVRG